MTVLISNQGSHPRPTPLGLSLLLGVPTEQLQQWLHNNDPIPAEWLQRGRRRRGEADAHTGDGDVFAALQYWAAKELGTDIVVLDDEAIL